MSRTITLKPGQKISSFLKPGEQIIKKSLDARHKESIKYVYTVGKRAPALLQPEVCRSSERPVVVGFGPAGMFASLYLARAGLNPIVIERGSDVDTRSASVKSFREGGSFSSDNNAQFGEGGAGTFSDGKLNTGTHDKRISQVLQIFYEHGADESVLYDSKPHIGTDVLVKIVKNIREEIISLGGEVRFNTCFEKILTDSGVICGIVANGIEIPCSNVILAIGHSARDSFHSLFDQQVPMERKAFSIGARIEHLQKDINFAQYGSARALPAADYKLSHDGVYTFCMCPGGYVFAANSEPDSVCTNGMSYSGRAGENSNSAVLVTVKPEDFPYEGVLGGMIWQQEIEKAAFIAGGCNYSAVCQLVGDFLANRPSTNHGKVIPTYKPAVKYGEISDILPDSVILAIREALPIFDKKLNGFADPEAVLTAPETRSSSPVRILRDSNCESSVRGLFPCGEGAGYAGGITSSAVDGLRCAEFLLNKLKMGDNV